MMSDTGTPLVANAQPATAGLSDNLLSTLDSMLRTVTLSDSASQRAMINTIVSTVTDAFSSPLLDDTVSIDFYTTFVKFYFYASTIWEDSANLRMLGTSLKTLAMSLRGQFALHVLTSIISHIKLGGIGTTSKDDVTRALSWIATLLGVLNKSEISEQSQSDISQILSSTLGAIFTLAEEQEDKTVFNSLPSSGVVRAAADILITCPSIAGIWSTTACAPRPLSKALGGIRVFTTVLGAVVTSTSSSAVFAEAKGPLLAIISNDIFAARDTVSSSIMDAFAPCFPLISSQDLSTGGTNPNDISAQLSRMLKRGPQIVLVPAASLFRGLAPGVAAVFGPEVLTCALPELRSAEGSRRAVAAEALAALAGNLSISKSNELRTSILTSLTSALMGRNGSPTIASFEVRAGLADAIASSTAAANQHGALTQAELDAIAGDLVEFLAKDSSAGKERSFSAIAMAFSTLSKITKQRLPVSAVSILVTALDMADATQPAYPAGPALEATLRLMEIHNNDYTVTPLRDALTAKGVTVVEKLTQLLVTAEARPAILRPVALRAACLILILTSKSKSSKKTEKVDNSIALPASVLTSIVSSTSFVNNVSIVKAADDQENLLLIRTFALLTSLHSGALGRAASADKVSGFATTMIFLLTHLSTTVRAFARKTFSLYYSNPTPNSTLMALSKPLLQALRIAAPSRHSVLTKRMGLSPVINPDTFPLTRLAHSKFIDSASRELSFVLRYVSPLCRNQTMGKTLALFLACSPLFAAHATLPRTVEAVERRVFTNSFVEDSLVVETLVQITAELFALPASSLTSRAWEVAGAVTGLSALALSSPRGFLTHAKPFYLDALSPNAMKAFQQAERMAIPPSEDDKEAFASFSLEAAKNAIDDAALPLRWALAGIRSVVSVAHSLSHSELLPELLSTLERLLRVTRSATLQIPAARTVAGLADALQGLSTVTAQSLTAALASLWIWASEEGKNSPFTVLEDKKSEITPAIRSEALSAVLCLMGPLRAAAEAAEDTPFPGATFRVIFPILDAVLRRAPLSLDVDTSSSSSSTPASPKQDEVSDEGEKDTESETSSTTTSEEQNLQSGLVAAATLLSSHAVAAASSNVLSAQNAIPAFDVLAMLGTTLAAIHRISTATGAGVSDELIEAEEGLAASLLRLCTTLSPTQTRYLLSDSGLFDGSAAVRAASLRALSVVQVLRSGQPEVSEILADAAARVWILMHDPEPTVSAAAHATWDALKLADFSASGANAEETLSRQIVHLSHPMAGVREASALAICALLTAQPAATAKSLTSTCLTALRNLFVQSPDEIIPAVGLRGKPKVIDRSATRLGVAACLLACTPLLSTSITSNKGKKNTSSDDISLLQQFFDFVLHIGFADRNQEVWEAIERAALRATHLHGSVHHAALAPIFEKALDSGTHPAWAILAAVASKSKKVGNNELEIAYEEVDRMREGAVLLFGTVARYHAPGSPEVVRTFERLLTALDTDSFDVKKTVATCMVPLVSALPSDGVFADATVRTLMTRAVSESKAHLRMGCARGFAAMIKGLRGPAMQKYSVLEFLAEKAGSSKPEAVHGALAAYGYLFEELGPLLGPYVTRVLPHLLPCFGQGDVAVRSLAQDVAGALMRHLSSAGVKLVLPAILQALSDKSWRAKVESIQLLGAMSSLAPRELAACLPATIPRLLDVLSDPNVKVQESARESIRRIGLAVRNPELRRIAPALISGLVNPGQEAVRSALQQLLTTTFRHYVDPASLALVMPLVRKGLRDVDAGIKKHAVQIAGAISLVVSSPKDMVPYMPAMLVYLRQLVMDSMPDVRQVTARALAAMYRASQSPVFPTFLEQLIGIMNHDHVKIPTISEQNIFADRGTTGVQRLGAALGAASLLHVQGLEAAQTFLATFEEKLAHPNQFVRESYVMALASVPQVYGLAFAPMLETAFPLVLQALSDSSATCRELAVKAGQQLVIAFARTQTPILLPSLIEALTDEDSRVRQGAVMLTANLLLRLAGLSGKLVIAEVDEDPAVPKTDIQNRADSVVTSISQERMIEDALGTEGRNDLYSSLYLMRSDSVSSVATVAWRVWKTVVPSSTRTLNLILGTLVDRIVLDLASWQEQRQITAGQAMADLVTKLGDRILREVVPILQDKLTSRDSFTRRGVCLGFTEILLAGSKQAVVAYMADFITCVRTALCDEVDEVRKAARRAFAAICASVGDRAVRDVVPPMLLYIDAKRAKYEKAIATMRAQEVSEEEIAEEKDESRFAILGLREILSLPICEREALELAIPFFIRPPVSAFHSECLATIAGALGSGFAKYVETVANSMLASLSECVAKLIDATETNQPEAVLADIEVSQAKLLENAEQMFSGLGVENTSALLEVFLQSTIVDYHETSDVIAATLLLGAFFRSTKAVLDTYLNEIWRHILPLLLQDSSLVLSATADTIGALTTNVNREALIKTIGFIRNQINSLTGKKVGGTTREIAEIPGLAVNNCAAHFIGFYQHGLVSGSTPVRVQAAAGLAELVELAPAEALRGSVVKLAGPLIRTFGDRYSSEIRASILQTLGLLVSKNGASLRAFQSQLQTTFVKALLDDSPTIRLRAAPALAQLMVESRRVDSLISELVVTLSSEEPERDGTEDADAPVVKASVAKALRLMYSDRQVTSRLEPETVQEVAEVLPNLLAHYNNPLRTEAARLTGAVVAEMSDEDASALMSRIMSYQGSESTHGSHGSWEARQGAAMALSAVEMACPERISTLAGGIKSIIRFIALGFNDDNELACTAVVRFAGRMVLNANNADHRQVVGVLVQELLKLAVAASKTRENVTLVALQQVSRFAEQDPSSLAEFNAKVIPLCIHARTGTGRPVRKEADTILYYCLGFNESADEGMENAEAFAENLPGNTAQEFLALCKRSVMKIKNKDDAMHATTAVAPSENQYED